MTCPFSNERCNFNCPLYVSSDDLNELVVSRLASIGVMKRTGGSCSLRLLALSQSRAIFENTNTRG